MATDFTVFARQYMKSSPLDDDIKVMVAQITNDVTDETNVLVPIPWENVRLVKAVAVITKILDAVAWEVDLELNEPAGTEMMTITIAKSSDVGSVHEATITTESACQNLSAVLAARDAICIETEAAAATGPLGAATVYMIFEPELDTV